MNAPVNPRETIGANSRPALVTADLLGRDHAVAVATIGDYEKQAADLPGVCEDDEDVGLIVALVKKLNASTKRLDELREGDKAPFLEATRIIDGFFGAKPNGKTVPTPGTLQRRVYDLKEGLEARVTRYQVKKANAEQIAREAEEQRLREEAAEKSRIALEAAQAASAGQTTPDIVGKMQDAADASKAADKAAVAAQAKPADLARTQTEAGTASLREDWTHKVENFAQIDLEALRNHFGPGDIDKAIRSFVKAGGRELAGVRIYAVPKTTIR
jgi:hypothetical protein